jgi:hypothetical protein
MKILSDAELLKKSVRGRALAMAQIGIPVFPVIAHNKQPLFAGDGNYTGEGPHNRWQQTTDPAVIRAWPWLYRLIGVPTGIATRSIVIDIDERMGGHIWEAEHLAHHVMTRVHVTRSGGRHWIFSHPGKGIWVSGPVSEIAPGVDIRADGNFVVAWPAHGFEVLGADLPLPLPPLPADILARCVKQRKPPKPITTVYLSLSHVHPRIRRDAEQALLNAAERVAASRKGYRNSTLSKATWSLQDHILEGSLVTDEVTNALAYAARAVGLEDSEITGTINSAFTAIMQLGG